METLEIHSKDFLVKWVHAVEGTVIDWQVKPLKKSINFAIYGKKEEDHDLTKENESGEEPTSTSEESKLSSLKAPSKIRLRSDSVNSVNEFQETPYKTKSRSSLFSSNLNKPDLELIKDYDKLIAGELVYGKYEVTQSGMFAFIFDNSFSKTTGKRVLFSSKIIGPKVDNSSGLRKIVRAPISAPSSGRDLGSSVLDTNDEIATETPIDNGSTLRLKNGELLQGVLLKKRKKKLQGFTKRFFVLNFKYGTLSYFRKNDNKLRGQMPIKQSIVSAKSQEREFVIDSGMEFWDLKALNQQDFQTWINAFNEIKTMKGFTAEEPTNDNSYLCSELEHISHKLDTFKLGYGSNNVYDFVDDISSSVKNLLSHFRPSVLANDSMSILSNDYVDAKDYFDQLNSGVLLLDHEQGNNLDNRIASGRFPSDESLRKDEGDDNAEVASFSSASTISDEEEEPTPTMNKNEAELGKKGEDIDDMDQTLYPLPHEPVERNTEVPASAHPLPSLLGLLRKNVGKDLSSVAMPVTMNEPITVLQKFAELLEYSELINNSLQSNFQDNGEKILRISAFAVSYLSSLRAKERNIRKPFNPLLGETYELVREDLGFRLIAEKVSHRPAIFALFVESEEWSLSFSPSPGQKYWGKNMEITTDGTVRLTIKSTGEVFTWSQPTSLLKNIIAGEKYVEPSSSMTIKSSTGYRAVVEFAKGSMFGGRSEDLSVKVYDPSKKELPYTVSGKWTESLRLKTKTTEKVIWEVGKLLPDPAKRFGFTEFTGGLNKVTSIEKGKIAPTDSRLRPDMRSYEQGDVEKAETLKLDLEQKQRDRRNEMEETNQEYKPAFFKRVGDDWVYIRGPKSYWNRRKNADWDDLVKLW